MEILIFFHCNRKRRRYIVLNNNDLIPSNNKIRTKGQDLFSHYPWRKNPQNKCQEMEPVLPTNLCVKESHEKKYQNNPSKKLSVI